MVVDDSETFSLDNLESDMDEAGAQATESTEILY